MRTAKRVFVPPYGQEGKYGSRYNRRRRNDGLCACVSGGVNKKKFGENSDLHYNSQAGIFFQAAKEMQKLLRLFNARENSYYIGLGDLYVTVYGGRTRLVGILLGEGYTIDEAKEKLSGVTLESLVVISRVAKAVKILIDKGILNAEDFPLLLHADEILTEKKPVELPWEKFAFRDF